MFASLSLAQPLSREHVTGSRAECSRTVTLPPRLKKLALKRENERKKNLAPALPSMQSCPVMPHKGLPFGLYLRSAPAHACTVQSYSPVRASVQARAPSLYKYILRRMSPYSSNICLPVQFALAHMSPHSSNICPSRGEYLLYYSLLLKAWPSCLFCVVKR